MSTVLLGRYRKSPQIRPVFLFLLSALSLTVFLLGAQLPIPDSRLFWIPPLIGASLFLTMILWIIRRGFISYEYFLFEDFFLIKRILFGHIRTVVRFPLSAVITMGFPKDFLSSRPKIIDCTVSLSARRVCFGIFFTPSSGKKAFVILECDPTFAALISKQCIKIKNNPPVLP